MTYRVLVFGSRTWTDTLRVYTELDAIAERVGDPIEVMHGDCPAGADQKADLWALAQTAGPLRRPADWDKHGRKAGAIRNGEMAKEGANEALGFVCPCVSPRCRRPGPHDSHGSADMWAKAVKAGIPVTIVRPEPGQ